MSEMIFDLQRFETINNSNSNSLVSGTSYSDSINNGYIDSSDTWHSAGTNVTIDAGAGNDSIWNSGDYAMVNVGAGNDYVINISSNVTTNGGTGDELGLCQRCSLRRFRRFKCRVQLRQR